MNGLYLNRCPGCGGMGYARGRYYWCAGCGINFRGLMREEAGRGS